MSLRTRQSITVLQDAYTAGNTKPLEDLMRAWHYIKAFPPSDSQASQL